MATLCLNMIVKNESHIIEETLENLCQYFPLDYWVISDTGSTDNTIEIITKFFKRKKIQGEIHQEAWRDFAYNRNKALEACTGKADYVLFFDADDLMQGQFTLPALTHDAYYFQFTDELGHTRYTRRLIIKNNQNYQWKCVLHELLENQSPVSEALLEGNYLVISRRQGDRNKDPQKVLKDALILQEAFYKGEDTIYLPRYAFYCAQSYRAHSFEDPTYLSHAIEWYKKRIELRIVGLDEDDEAYVSCEYLGIIYQEQKQFEHAIAIWQKGIMQDPLRAECWYHAARYFRLQQHWQLAYAYAQQGAALAKPQGRRIFLNHDIHQFWCLFELCIITFKLQQIEESYTAFKKLIRVMPAYLFNDFIHIIPSYLPYLNADRYDQVMQIQADLTRLGHAQYLTDVLAEHPIHHH